MSSSSSMTPPAFKHDVFLSFIGQDNVFTNVLTSSISHALALKGIDVFFDEEFCIGDDMPPPVRKEIKESRISVVIFSQSYASSRRCLNELVHIQECKKVYDQTVIPVFYGIEPFDVKKQTGSFADAFRKHEHRHQDKVQERWRNALTEISSLDGFNSRNYRPQSLLIEIIVKDILKKLDIKEQDGGNEYNRVIHKITAEQMFVAINFMLEVPSAVFDKLSSLHKPQYALLSMIMSFTTMLICIIQLGYKGGEGRVGWRWREKIPWFYYPSRRPFGTATDFIGLFCAIFQCIFAATDYACYVQHINDPIKLSVWPLIFASCLLCSNLLKNLNKKML